MTQPTYPPGVSSRGQLSHPAAGIGVYGAGAVSCLGLSLQRHAALIGAQIPGGRLSDEVPGDTSPLPTGFLPHGTLSYPPAAGGPSPWPEQPHYNRLLALAAGALGDLQGPREIRPAVYLTIPPSLDPAQMRRYATDFLHDLHGLTHRAFDLHASRLFIGGEASFFEVLQRAMHEASHRQAWVIAAAADSFCDATRLAALQAEQRLARIDHIDGFVPGEGAGCVLLGPDKPSFIAAERWAHGASVGLGLEPGHHGSSMACRGDGLTHALAHALTPHAMALGPMAHVFAGYTGEQACTKEWGAASLRHHASLCPGAPFQHHVAYIGHAGSALAALQMATAALHMRQGLLRGPALIWGLEDGPQRGAAVLHPVPSSPRESLEAQESQASMQQPREVRAWYDELTDICVDEAAFAYRSWRTLVRRRLEHADERAALEAHLEQLMAALKTDPNASVLLEQRASEADADVIYVAVRRRLSVAALARQPLNPLFDRLDWNAPETVSAVVDGIVHAEGAYAPVEVMHALAQHPARAEALARAAQRLHWREAVPWLQRALRSAPLHRAALVRALGFLGTSHDVGVLTVHLSSHRRATRRAAALGLLRLGARERVAEMGEGHGLGFWLHALAGDGASYASLCTYADAHPHHPHLLYAWGVFGSPQAIPFLLSALEGGANLREAEAALYLVLGERPAPQQSWPALWHLRSKNFEPARRYRLGQPYGIAALLQTVRDPSVPQLLRRVAGLELTLRYALDVGYSPRLTLAQAQARHTAAARAAASLPSAVDGEWVYTKPVRTPCSP